MPSDGTRLPRNPERPNAITNTAAAVITTDGPDAQSR